MVTCALPPYPLGSDQDTVSPSAWGAATAIGMSRVARKVGEAAGVCWAGSWCSCMVRYCSDSLGRGVEDDIRFWLVSLFLGFHQVNHLSVNIIGTEVVF